MMCSAALQAGHGEIIAWSYEMAAWFVLTEGCYHDVIDYAQEHAGLTNATIQLVLQQARGQARIGDRCEATPACTTAPNCWSSNALAGVDLRVDGRDIRGRWFG